MEALTFEAFKWVLVIIGLISAVGYGLMINDALSPRRDTSLAHPKPRLGDDISG